MNELTTVGLDLAKRVISAVRRERGRAGCGATFAAA